MCPKEMSTTSSTNHTTTATTSTNNHRNHDDDDDDNNDPTSNNNDHHQRQRPQEEQRKQSVTKRRKTNGTSRYISRASTIDGNTTYEPIRPIRSQNAALWELAGGVSVYIICVSLPTILGIIVRCYQNFFLFSHYYPGGGVEGDHHPSHSSLNTAQSSLFDHSPHSGGFLENHENHTIMQNFTNVPKQVIHFLQEKAESYRETNALSDIQFMVLLSVTLALFRALITYMLVPRSKDTTPVEAMVRCTSTHMLSSREYQFSSSSLKSNHNDHQKEENDKHQRPIARNIAKKALRIVSAPRYATAIFRLCFCTLSCTFALTSFSSANFWPVWVGGYETAHTKNCWDLSGSVAQTDITSSSKGGRVDHFTIDVDFDDRNSALRVFFLSQASYQLHSLGFHVLSMILVFLSKDHRGRRVESIKTLCVNYMKPLLEHLLYLTLILGSFIFSALRRLGAIAIFSLEASSLFIQILQICINAPEDSWRNRPRTIKLIHRFVVVPIFVYCRLFVLPFIVLYSAAFESNDWIRQIERATTQGCGLFLYGFFNALLVLAVALNLMFLRRLLFHPYMHQMLTTTNIQNSILRQE